MPFSPSSLVLHVHLIDGSTLKYQQESAAEAKRIVDMIQPNKLFAQQQFLLAGSYSVTGFNAKRVERVDLIMEGRPDWTMPEELTELTREEFVERYRPDEDPAMRRDAPRPRGHAEERGFAEFEMASGRRIFLELRVTPGSPLEQRSVLQHILASPALFFPREEKVGGGVTLLNPANIARWTLYPGPPEAPANAWKVHRYRDPSGKGPTTATKAPKAS